MQTPRRRHPRLASRYRRLASAPAAARRGRAPRAHGARPGLSVCGTHDSTDCLPNRVTYSNRPRVKCCQIFTKKLNFNHIWQHSARKCHDLPVGRGGRNALRAPAARRRRRRRRVRRHLVQGLPHRPTFLLLVLSEIQTESLDCVGKYVYVTIYHIVSTYTTNYH